VNRFCWVQISLQFLMQKDRT